MTCWLVIGGYLEWDTPKISDCGKGEHTWEPILEFISIKH